MSHEPEIRYTATLTCPHCGHAETETMVDDRCEYYYECRGCGRVLKPLKGDCCVFCLFADASCPPVQATRLRI